MKLERRLPVIALIFVGIIAFGGLGYSLIEGWPLVDALYMAVITVTTVGFGEVHPLTTAGRLFTAALILLGVGAITYSFSALANYVIAGEVQGLMEGRRMKRRIEALQGHYIVCGFGRMGQQVCCELEREGYTLIVIEAQPAAAERARQQGYLVLEGNAGHDQVLLSAGIQRAQGLVACVDSDASNLFVVLSARALQPELYIVTRADSQDTQQKLMRGGADRVISPYSLGGSRMAQLLLRPDVVEFLDVVMHDESLELFLENLTVEPGCQLDGCKVGAADIRATTGANILGLKRDDGLIVSPDPLTTMVPGDVLIAMGTRQQLQALASMVRAQES
jgi:voltage-gated potassium channel